MRIITADERLSEVRGPKILIGGPPGVGKTTLLRTLNVEKTLFFDLEAGDLAVQDLPVDQVRARSWVECRDLACYLGGPNRALDNDKSYSQAHYDHVVEKFGDASDLDKYDIYFVDSITVAARLCLQWAQQQPEGKNAKGDQDLRGAYGLLGREMIGWITHLQHAKEKAVILVGIVHEVKDDFKRSSWELQIDGQKAGREIPGIVDEVLAMGIVRFGEGDDAVTTRALICSPETALDQYPGFTVKDRSGRLDGYEKPDLGALLTKLTRRNVPRQSE